MTHSSISRIVTIGFLHTCACVLMLTGLASAKKQAATPDDLKLTVVVTGQTYCSVAKDAFTTVLHLKLTFTNTSNHAVIVSRKFTSAPGAVAKTIEDGTNGQFEVKTAAADKHSFPAMSPWALGPRPPSMFATLKAGETVTTRFDFPILSSTSNASNMQGSIGPGEHVLFFKVETWPYPGAGEQGIKNLQKRWRRFGRLSAETIEAEPVGFAVPDEVSPRGCVTKRPRLPGWTIEQK